MRSIVTLFLVALLISLAGCSTMEDWGRSIKKQWNSMTDSMSGETSSTAAESQVSSSNGFTQADIRKVQQRLRDEGYDPGPVDGKMGPQTRNAIRQYQGSVGLEKTGDLDDQTVGVLGVH